MLQSSAMLDELRFPLCFRAHDATLDCVVGAVLAIYRLLHHRWPEALTELVNYVVVAAAEQWVVNTRLKWLINHG